MALINLIFALAYSAGSAIAFKGDATWYNPENNACGEKHGLWDYVVALPPSHFGHCPDLPKNCPTCEKKMIHIQYKGKTTTAAVKDICSECAGDSIKVSPKVFQSFENLDVERIQVTWQVA